jgi:predicted ATPase
MTTLNDEILRATGGPTVNDGLATFFSKTATESLQDAEARWLLSDVSVTKRQANQDMWYVFLRNQGFGPGSVNDMKLKYWASK